MYVPVQKNGDSRFARSKHLVFLLTQIRSFEILIARKRRNRKRKREWVEQRHENSSKIIQHIIVNDRSENIPCEDQLVASNKAWLEYSMKSCFQTYNKSLKTYSRCMSFKMRFSRMGILSLFVLLSTSLSSPIHFLHERIITIS